MFSTHLKFTYNYVTVTICVEVSKSTELKSYDSKYIKEFISWFTDIYQWIYEINTFCVIFY